MQVVLLYISYLGIFIPIISAELSKKVLLFSLDGFRWDYFEKTDTPNFDRIAKTGVKAPYINGTFLTKTFPSHYTIATGLFEESHGIINNRMYDPSTKRYFSPSKSTDAEWWGGEPIWNTVRRQGLFSGVYFWPGSEANINNLQANKWRKFNLSIPLRTRIDTALEWFTKNDANLVMLYSHEPDQTGHTYGPESPEVVAKIKEMDDEVGYLLQKLDEKQLSDKVNLLLVSDHGMTTIPQNQIINLSDYVDLSLIDLAPDYGSCTNILPKDGKKMELYNALKSVPNVTVYLKEDIPERFHYKNNRRVMPILVLADEGWIVRMNSSYEFKDKGAHGYNNEYTSMKPMFLARGPNIKPDHTAEPFSQVDIYPLICSLLDIQPAQNNGSLDGTKDFIIKDVKIGPVKSGALCIRTEIIASNILLPLFLMSTYISKHFS